MRGLANKRKPIVVVRLNRWMSSQIPSRHGPSNCSFCKHALEERNNTLEGRNSALEEGSTAFEERNIALEERNIALEGTQQCSVCIKYLHLMSMIDPYNAQNNQAKATSRQELDVTALPWANKAEKVPDYAYQLHSHVGKLTVTVINYGERQPGAETVHIRLSRPVEGCDCLDTTNGIAEFSGSGTHLLLYDLFTILVIDVRSMHVRHFALPPRTLFRAVGWEGEAIIGKTHGYAQPISEVKPFGPWPWETIEAEWKAGIGKQLTISPCRL